MKYVFKYQIIRLILFIIPNANTRSKILKKIKYFNEMGNNVFFQPRHIPADPKFIKFHNNIAIASGVTFITHDVLHYVLNRVDEDHEYNSKLGCIEIMDNVFIGANSIIMPDVRIGSNTIIAAGSIITKDIPDGWVVGGVPAKKIGTFNDIMKKRQNLTNYANRNMAIEPEWVKFYEKRNK